MSTRSNTIFEFNGGKKILTFYRHCDGYPEGHGADLCQALIKADGDIIDTLAMLKLFDIEIEDVDAIHGDIEYLYKVTFQNPWENHPESVPPVVVTVYRVRRGKVQEIVFQGEPKKVRMDITMGKFASMAN